LDLSDALCGAKQPQTRELCGDMVAHALTQPAEEVRVKAVAILMARPDLGPPAAVVDRLGDPSAAVRRAAMLAVGPSRNLIADDDLLRWLHDPDAEVRRLCETALRSRGLRTQDVRMGRLLTDARPNVRLELLPYLRRDMDLDVSTWLRRLTLDPAPAVRAGAVRAAAEQQVAGLADRLAQMAGTDPDPTVRENARYYLGRMRMEQPAGWQPSEVQR
jgi:HEAT repeat protein